MMRKRTDEKWVYYFNNPLCEAQELAIAQGYLSRMLMDSMNKLDEKSKKMFNTQEYVTMRNMLENTSEKLIDAVNEAFKAQKTPDGKWMLYFRNPEEADKYCKKAVGDRIVEEAKYNKFSGRPACFYVNSGDKIGHKLLLKFFLDNNLIPRTKSGRLYNIPFKTNAQTAAGKYGKDFKAEITLDQFVNLDTGEMIV